MCYAIDLQPVEFSHCLEVAVRFVTGQHNCGQKENVIEMEMEIESQNNSLHADTTQSHFSRTLVYHISFCDTSV